MYILSADCIEVKGYQRSAICDLRRQAFYEGPHIEDVKKIDTNYLDFLLENEIIIEVPDDVAHAFKPIELNYNSYSFISNAVVEFGQHLNKVMEVLEWGLCYNFAVTISNPIEIEALSEFLKQSYNRIFNSIELHFFIQTHTNDYIAQINDLLQKYTYINPFLYTETRQVLNDVNRLNNNRFMLMPVSFYMANHIGLDFFYCNIEFFVESQKHNTYYNRKIFIDEHGNISNIKKGKKYGNVIKIASNEGLCSIIQSDDFQILWNVGKEKIDICKDCEYRHLCIDNRIPVQRKDGSWYHKSECPYNPYICKWRGEDGFVGLKDSGILVNNDGFSLNAAQLNNTIEAVNS